MGLSALALAFAVVMMFRPVPQSMRDRPVPTSTSTTTTTIVTSLSRPWGSVAVAGIALGRADICNNVMVDVQVTDPAALGRAERWIKLTGSSGNLYAVTPVVLRPGTNPVVMTVCARQDTEWRPTVTSPWGESKAFTLKSFSRCVHVMTEAELEEDSIVLTSFCPVPKS